MLGRVGREILGTHGIVVATFDAARENLEVQRADGDHPVLSFQSMPASLKLPGPEAVRQQRPIYVASVPDLLRDFPEAQPWTEGTRAWAAIPLEARQGVFGFLGLSYEHEQGFAADQRLLLESVAQLFSLAYDRNRLVDVERQARRQTEDNQRWSRLLSRASEALFGAPDAPTVLTQVARLAAEDLAEWAVVEMLQDGKLVEAASALKDESARAPAGRPEQTLVARPSATTVVAAGRSALLSDLQTSGEPDTPASWQPGQLGSVIMVPILSGKTAIGAISLTRTAQQAPYTSAEVERAEELARMAASALATIRLSAELRGSRDLLDSVLRNIDDAITVQDAQGRLVYANDAAARLVGVADADTYLKSSPHDLAGAFHVLTDQGTEFPPADLPGRRALQGLRAPTVPLRLRHRKSGLERWALVGATPILDAEGKPCFAVNVVRDITPLRRAQDELKRMNAELEGRIQRRTEDLRAAIGELEAFNYSVSHDLRTPLRGIRGFATLLSDEQGSRLDGRGRVYLGYILEATAQMNQIIESLLRLSRVASAQPKRQSVDIAQQCTDTIANLRTREPRRNVVLRVQPSIRLDADPQLTRIVLENLLQNAWKFTRSRAEARIEVGQTGEADEPVLFVRDNGVGFDMTEAGLLFRPFRRLSTASGYEGSGVGLATVRRIAERHGGHVWAEATRGQGATFYVSFGRRTVDEASAPPTTPTVRAPLATR